MSLSPGDRAQVLDPAVTAPGAVTPARRTWRDELAQGLAALQAWPWLDTLRTLALRFREDRLGITASSLTFTTLISLVPLFTVMLAVFSAFPMFSRFQVALQTYFLQSLVPDTIAKPVLSALTQFAAKSSSLGGAGLAVLAFTAITLMLTIDRTLNAIWRVPRPRPIAQRVLVYWGAATLGPLLLGVSLSLTSYALSVSKGLVNALPGGVSFLLNVFEFGLFALGMAALFHYVPNTEVKWRHAVAGGLFVAIGIEAAKKGLSWYLASIPSYSVVYGAFATVPIFLLWLYLGWVIVLLGAVIAAYAPSLQMRVVGLPRTPGARFALALELLRRLEQARLQAGRGLTAEQLCQQVRIDPLQVESLLGELLALDWVGRLDEVGPPRYLLLCEPTTTPVAALVSRLLLEPTPQVKGFWQHTAMDALPLAEVLRRP